jgi:hypothetical protein
MLVWNPNAGQGTSQLVSYTHVGWRDSTGNIKIQQIWDIIGVARPVCRSTRCQKGVLLTFGCGQTLRT